VGAAAGYYEDSYQICKGLSIAMGSNEVMRNIICWVGMGLPRLKGASRASAFDLCPLRMRSCTVCQLLPAYSRACEPAELVRLNGVLSKRLS